MTAAVIVAAGLSSRMGAFKPLLPLGGSTVIGCCVAALRAGGVEKITAVTGHRGAELSAYLEGLGVTAVHNPDYAATDMLASAKLGLAAVPQGCGGVFFMPGDSPAFRPSTLSALLERMRETGCHIAVPVYGGRAGHPLLIAPSAIPALTGFRGDGGLRGAIAASGLRRSRLPVEDPGILLDADTPEDYEILCKYVNGA